MIRGWRVRPETRRLARAFDITLLLVAAPVVLPLCVVVAVAIWVIDGAPILYRAKRLGCGGELFMMYKFRTMRGDGGNSPSLTRANDPRVTPIGRNLRRWKLDELPQLLNVLRGDMGLVGPRPEDPRYREHMRGSVMIEDRCLPGITSAASVALRSEEELHVGDLATVEERYLRDILPRKIQAEREYLQIAGPLQDLYLLVRSVFP